LVRRGASAQRLQSESHGPHEFKKVKGLREHRGDSELRIVARALRGATAGRNDDRQVQAFLANPLDELQARKAWHFVVGDKQIIVSIAKRFPGLLAVGSRVHSETVINQDAGYELAQEFVLRDENSSRMERDRRFRRVPDA
jgi:hypothetical protein